MIMWDPNSDRFDVKQAEDLLDMTDFERMVVRNAAMLDLLLAKGDITEDQINLAYEQRLRQQLREARDNLNRLVGDDENVVE